MPDPRGANARRATEIHFTDTISIAKADLDRAIGGGIKKGGGAASRQERDELFSAVYLRLVRHFVRGGDVTDSVGSLAFRLGRNAAIDAFRRPGNAARRCEYIEAADATPAVEIRRSIETGEDRVIRLSEIERRGRLLRDGLGRISADDYAALLGMIMRETALPRGTAEEVRIANATAQREKRARDRLAKAVRDREDPER